ncbi:MAG: hypothetical protein ABIK09_18020 [Pseudomonadota bacterium]
MDAETIIQDLAAALDKADPPPPRGTVLGVLEDQVVLSAGGADTRAFVDVLEEGFRVEAHAVVEIDGDVDEEQLRREAIEAMDEDLWPQLSERGYASQEDDWNPELGLLTRFGVRTIDTFDQLTDEIYFLASADLHEAYEAE